jgi:hypothetical protein
MKGQIMSEEEKVEIVKMMVIETLRVAKSFGMFVTIETKPRQSLAMGNYDLHYDIRPIRARADQ